MSVDSTYITSGCVRFMHSMSRRLRRLEACLWFIVRLRYNNVMCECMITSRLDQSVHSKLYSRNHFYMLSKVLVLQLMTLYRIEC